MRAVSVTFLALSACHRSDEPIAAATAPAGRCVELAEPRGARPCPYAATGQRDRAGGFELGQRCELAGSLRITSGRIVATDPLVQLDRAPFARAIEPGTYPVWLAIDTGQDAVGFALLRLGEARPVRWEPADPGRGYGVDTGIGCFADAASATTIAERERAEVARAAEVVSRRIDPADYDRWHDELQRESSRVPSLLDVMNAQGLSAPHPRAVHVCVDPDTGANLVAFRSGIGDGVYASYFGLDARGAVVALVTDFKLADLGEGRHPALESVDGASPVDR
jgi:hypothetical protein